MQPTPSYTTLPVVFSSATKVQIPEPTIDTGYAEGTALPTEHYSWLNYTVSEKISELASTCTSLITEMNNFLVANGVTPNNSLYTQFQTALNTKLAGATVLNATNATSATTASTCTGNAATATYATTAGSAALAGGVDFVNGGYSEPYQSGSISPGASVLIPKGSYIFVCTAGNSYDDGLCLQIKRGTSSWDFSGSTGPIFNGFIVSDGEHYRLYNNSTYNRFYNYVKLA